MRRSQQRFVRLDADWKSGQLRDRARSEYARSDIRAVSPIRGHQIETFRSPVAQRALEELKFAVCLPDSLSQKVLEERTTDRKGVSAVLTAPVRFVSLTES
jgi:hypothetical protein